MSYKPKQLADWLQVSSATIRLWARDYGEFISPNARGGEGRHRVFDEQDTRVIAHIYTLKKGGNSVEDIANALQALMDDNWTALPPMPDPPPQTTTKSVMVSADQVQSAIANATKDLQQDLDVSTVKIEMLETSLDQKQEALEQEQTAHQKTRENLLEARQEVGKLEGEKTGVVRERKLYTAGLIAVAIVAAILLVAVLWLVYQAGIA